MTRLDLRTASEDYTTLHLGTLRTEYFLQHLPPRLR